jgi:hypothetical protein
MDALRIVLVLLGFGAIALAGARLGAGSTEAIIGLFSRADRLGWPRGVQEPDAPRFALDRLGPGRADAGIGEGRAEDDVPPLPAAAIEAVPATPPHWRG